MDESESPGSRWDCWSKHSGSSSGNLPAEGMVHARADLEPRLWYPLWRARLRIESELIAEDAEMIGTPGWYLGRTSTTRTCARRSGRSRWTSGRSRRLPVAFTDGSGRFIALAHAPRTDPADLALQCCIEYLGAGAVAAVAFCDEPVDAGPPSPEAVERFVHAQSVATRYGLRLVDWIACDDQRFRSMRLSQDPELPWNDLP